MRTTGKLHVMALGLAFILSAWATAVMAATNQATDPGGGGVSLSVSNTVTINPLALSIMKEARLLNGTLLASPVSLPANTKFYFVLYVDNTTDIALNDVRIIDTIATGAGNFTVDAASFQILNTVAAPGIDMTAANIASWGGSATWNALTWSALTAGVDADQLDWNVTAANRVTIGQLANAALNVAASGQANKVANPHRAAFRFAVTINP
jgi:hypothetical protein